MRIGGYLDHLATGSALAGGTGIQDYLSSVGSSSAIQGASATAVKSYLDGMSSGAVAAPSAPAVQSYLDGVSSGATAAPTSGSGIASYLTSMGTGTALSGGAGIATHVGTLSSGSQLSGPGIGSYLDSVGSAVASPGVDVPAIVASHTPANGVASAPSTTVDTQVSHAGSQTTVVITSVTTVVIDE